MIKLFFFIFYLFNLFSSNYLTDPSLNLIVPSIEPDNIYKLEFNLSFSRFEFDIKNKQNINELDNYFWSPSTYSKDFLSLGFDFTFYRIYNYFEALVVGKYGSAGAHNYFVEAGLNFKTYLTWLKYFEMFYLKFGLTYIHNEQSMKVGDKSFDLIQAGISPAFGIGIKLLAYRKTLLSIEFEKKYLSVSRADIFYNDSNHDRSSIKFKDYLGSYARFSTILLGIGWYI